MACSVVRSPLILNPTVRHYAAAAAAQCSASATPECQVLNNKLTVATIDNNNPVSQISILFRAGSRYETYDTQGVSHHLRIAAGLTTSRSSTFAITRNIQQLGGNIFATTDRESIAYTLQVTRDNLAQALGFLEDVATRPVFHPWELSDQLPRLRYELSSVPEFTRVIELLHKAAYRTGLGYSLYSPKRQLGRINSETLKHFVNTLCTAPRCAVVATGVPFSEVCAFANNLSLSSDGTVDQPAKYYGGEVRKERSSALANVAVALEGAGLDKEKEAIAFAVLQAAAGTGPRVKWGGSTSSLHRAVLTAAGSSPFAISALNASYSDSGLFGFVLSAPGDTAGVLTKAAYAWLRSPKLTDADINRGKMELKTAVYYSADSSSELLENLGQQALLKHRVHSPSTIAAEIDKVSVSDVKALCGKLGSGKVSMAAIGDLRTVPYVDQLS